MYNIWSQEAVASRPERVPAQGLLHFLYLPPSMFQPRSSLACPLLAHSDTRMHRHQWSPAPVILFA